MSTPSDPPPPAPGTGPAQPTTQEIPAAAPASARTTIQQLPPPSAPVPPPATAVQPAPVPVAQPTGPVDFVPGLPGAGSAPPPAAAGPSWPETLESGAEAQGEETGSRERGPRDRGALVRAGLVLLSLVLLQLGLSLDFGTASFWSALPLWSVFATGCVVLGLATSAAVLPRGGRLDRRLGWRIAAGGLTGLAVFWVLVVLPAADSDRGFLLTAALGALGGAVWLAAGRDD
ncbi:hypothetical protein [Blastococcus capsensis]|uniref:hypothetical protein n=1 Tax=Blastococcus capsensis TaxID=1564163 RepID=UPI0025418BF9|nr:hypothetical protein [Blastococcus capsensis]MDK3255087.1 hypothetical protein [Blastococcus capsensis]